jgi:DNA-binding MltR family transcriptional regulator
MDSQQARTGSGTALSFGGVAPLKPTEGLNGPPAFYWITPHSLLDANRNPVCCTLSAYMSVPVKLVEPGDVDFPTDLPREELSAFFEQSSDRAMGIMWAAIVENHLTAFLRLIMYRGDKAVADELFKPTGPLGAFGTKIKLAYLLRVIDPITYKDYIYISKIRNAFAHDLSKTSFDDQQIDAWIKNMHIYSIVKIQSENAIERLNELEEMSPTEHIVERRAAFSIASQFLRTNRDAYRQCLRNLIHQLVYREKQIHATEKAMNEAQPATSPKTQ